MADILSSDIMTIVLSADGQLTVNDQPMTLEKLRQEVTRFAAVNPKHRVIAVKTAPQTKYNDYFQLQNAIVAAYKPLKCTPRISDVVEEEGGTQP